MLTIFKIFSVTLSRTFQGLEKPIFFLKKKSSTHSVFWVLLDFGLYWVLDFLSERAVGKLAG